MALFVIKNVFEKIASEHLVKVAILITHAPLIKGPIDLDRNSRKALKPYHLLK